MNIKWLLFSSDGTLSRKDFWRSILIMYSVPYLLTLIGDEIFIQTDLNEMTFVLFFMAKMLPRLLAVFVLACTYYIAKKRINEINGSAWIPIIYIISIFLPTFLIAAGLENIAILSGIVPIVLTFYLGLATPNKSNLG
ncbi:MAG: DUF805 domain-containing protein [Thermodesulfobacteriota bacterium]|nr:DUF805 domain-containing protein [Thermodesulfobacteriota bacterium]|tara:strand:- start:594 stop:1007 length:414 start_codon:yes stop_codon:yes gene_type:complete